MVPLSQISKSIESFTHLCACEKSLTAFSASLQHTADAILARCSSMKEANDLVTKAFSSVADQKSSIQELTQMANEYLLPLESESSLFVDPLNSVSFHTAALELVRHIIKLNLKQLLSKSLAQYLNSIVSREYLLASDIFTDTADLRVIKIHQLITRTVDRYYDVEGFMLKHFTEYLYRVKALIPKLATTDSVLFITSPPFPWSFKMKTRSFHSYSMVSLTSWQGSPAADVLSSVASALANLDPEKLSKQARESILPWLNTVCNYIEQGLTACYSTVIVLLYLKPVILTNILSLMNKCHGVMLPCIFKLQSFSSGTTLNSSICRSIKPLISSLCAESGSLQICVNGNSLSNYAAKLSTLSSASASSEKNFLNSIIVGYREVYDQLLRDSHVCNPCSNMKVDHEIDDPSEGFVAALAIAEFNPLDHKHATTELDDYISRYPPNSVDLLIGKRPSSALKKNPSVDIPMKSIMDAGVKDLVIRCQSLYSLSKPFVVYIYSALEFCSAYGKGDSLWNKLLSVSPDFFNLTMEEHKSSMHTVLQEFAAHLRQELTDALACVPIGEKLCILQLCLTNSCDGIAEMVAESITTYILNITKRRESIRTIATSSDSTFAFITALLAYLHKALTLLLSYASTRMLNLVSKLIKTLEHEYVTMAHKIHRSCTEATHLSRLAILTHAKYL